MKKNFAENDILTARCAEALRAIMRFRKIKVPILAAMTGISNRTIEGYTSGRVPIQNARARNVILIADALSVDARVLVGIMSIDHFYQMEEIKKRREEQAKERRRAAYKEVLRYMEDVNDE